MLKVAVRHAEAEHQAEALELWSGRGAVRLERFARIEHFDVLLLEACRPGRPLSARPVAEQDAIIGGLLPRLWVEPRSPHPFRPLQAMCDAWAAESELGLIDRNPAVDVEIVRTGLGLLRELPVTASRSVLLCTDLHARNVLESAREPWLVIDPKPYLGDPAFDPVQHLLNSIERVNADPHGCCRRVADLVEVDADRLAMWLFARVAQESLQWPELRSLARRLVPT